VGEEHKTLDLVTSNSTLRIQEYFLLAGRLFKYFELYGKAPPANSWVWRFFDDGATWKKAVKSHGKEAVPVMIRKKLGLSTPKQSNKIVPSSPFSDVANKGTPAHSDDSSSSLQSCAIFYRIEVQRHETEHIRAMIEKQLQAISESHAALLVPRLNVYYTTSGHEVIANALGVETVCSTLANIFCINLGHVEDNGEQAALSVLHEFCSANVTERVVFVDTRGGYEGHTSFSEAKQQRLLATKAVTSKNCLQPPDLTCNVCGHSLYTQWGFMMMENMWSADCAYVKKLLHPRIFEERWKASTEDILLMKQYGQLATQIFPELPEVFGVDEHVFKQWVGSHPSLKPCVFEIENNLGWSMAPIGHSAPRDWNQTVQEDLMNNDYGRIREASLLGGRLMRWLRVYNETPADDSFVWHWFPDAAPWKAAAKKGIPTIRSVLSDPTLLSSFDESGGFQGKAYGFNSSASPGWVLFYNVFIPPDSEGQVRTVKIIEEQLGQVKSSFACSKPGYPLTIFVSTIGATGTSVLKKITHFCLSSKSIRCIHMGHHESGHENVTLQHIHDFCSISDHEALRFGYIHTKGSFHPSIANERWRRHSTMAVTSEGCLKPPDDRCNVCGLQFYPIWNIFFPGNFFAAHCRYIKRLISPKYFGERLLRMSTRLREYQKAGRLFAYNLFDHGLPWRQGVDRFAWEIWSGTHPSIVPCDMSPSPDHSYWREMGNRQESELVWSMAPRQKGLNESWFLLDSKRRERVMGSKDLRMRDYFLLPGNIAKWALLYDENENPFATVPHDSWLWSWFPDGNEWKEAVQQNGKRAFELVTDQFLPQHASYFVL